MRVAGAARRIVQVPVAGRWTRGHTGHVFPDRFPPHPFSGCGCIGLGYNGRGGHRRRDAMLEAALGLSPLPVAFGAGGLLALAYVARNARKICFVAAVAGAVAAALAFR